MTEAAALERRAVMESARRKLGMFLLLLMKDHHLTAAEMSVLLLEDLKSNAEALMCGQWERGE
jgi:hypothetical protein